MGLPREGQTWPPKTWEDVFNLYAEHAAWYSGDPNQLANVHSRAVYTPTPRGRFWAADVGQERRVMLHVPTAGDISTISADLLFGEAPKITIPEAEGEISDTKAAKTDKRLQEIIDAGDVLSRLLEGAESASALGGVYIRIGWHTAVANVPILSVVQADAAIPEFRWGLLQSVTFWRVVEDENQKIWRHVERHEKGRILHALYIGSWDNLGYQVNLKEHSATESLEKEIILPFDGLAVRYIPNIRPHRRFRNLAIGRSDYDGLEGLMDALDEVWTSWIRDIRLAKARIIVPQEYLERIEDVNGNVNYRFDIDQELFTPLEMSPEDDKKGITPNQFAIRTEEHRTASLELLDRIISSAGYSPQTFGLKIEGRVESGTALNARERRTFMIKAKKERYWKAAIEDLLQIALIIDKEQFRSGVEPYRPNVEFQDSLANDPAQIAQSVELLNRAQAASIDTKVRMLHPDWSEQQIEAEVLTIKQEQGLIIEDPIQVGIS